MRNDVQQSTGTREERSLPVLGLSGCGGRAHTAFSSPPSLLYVLIFFTVYIKYLSMSYRHVETNKITQSSPPRESENSIHARPIKAQTQPHHSLLL